MATAFKIRGEYVQEGKADYVIGLKGNQSTLLENTALHFEHYAKELPCKVTDLERFAYAVRKHWAVENQLHWYLDVIFDEDSCRAKKDMSPLNLNVLRITALTLCNHADFGRRISIQKKRFAAALNPDRFLDILFAKL